MVIYIHIKFHRIPLIDLIDYLVADICDDETDGWLDGRNDRQTDRHGENYILPPSAGDKKGHGFIRRLYSDFSFQELRGHEDIRILALNSAESSLFHMPFISVEYLDPLVARSTQKKCKQHTRFKSESIHNH